MVFVPVKYAYLLLSVSMLAVWLALLLLHRQGRRRQVLLSAVFSLAGPIGELFYIPDYWHPVTVLSVHVFDRYVSIEDFIFSFAIMGIVSSLPAWLVHPRPAGFSELPSGVSILKMIGVLAAVAAFSLVLWFAGVNSIFATSIAMLVAAIVLLTNSRRLLLARISVTGGIAMLLLMFAVYWIAFVLVSDSDRILQATWSLYGTSLGLQFLRVPLSELVWAFCFGSFFSALFASDSVGATKEA